MYYKFAKSPNITQHFFPSKFAWGIKRQEFYVDFKFVEQCSKKMFQRKVYAKP
jgi:hypothetical protein